MAKRNSIPVRLPNGVQKMVSEAAALDARRQKQISNQIDSINRLLEFQGREWTYDEEMRKLHEQLATAQARIDELESSHIPPRRMSGAEEESDMGRRKDAFYAGFAAGETEDSVDESWKEYKAEQDQAEADTDEDGDDE